MASRGAPRRGDTDISGNNPEGHPVTLPATEPDEVRHRYARRASQDWRYNLLNPSALLALQERHRATTALLRQRGLTQPDRLDILEVGCGTGGNLLDWLRLGADPTRLSGIELLPDRHAIARATLPSTVRLFEGDATQAPIAPASQDVVMQATVFSSLLDDAFQQRLADAMWAWLRPGGGVLWYDFTVDNPRNPDVRGVSLRRVRALFPHGAVQARRVTLAPPLARAACRVHPSLYALFNSLPWLRTHVLAWIAKPPSP